MNNDYQVIKDGVPIPYVLQVHGHTPERVEGGRLTYFSPFRPDENPSFDVWEDEEKGWRWGDFAEGKGGDVLDLIQRFHAADLPTTHGFKYMSDIAVTGYTPPELTPRQQFDAAAAHNRTESTYEEVNTCIQNHHFEDWEFINPKPGIADISVAELYTTWKLAADGDALILPYFGVDGTLTGYKARTRADKRNAPGAALTLYGLWRLDDTKQIVLVEGETDAWAAQHALGPAYVVLAIPGSNTRPEKVGGPLDGRDVVICFDPDDAGNKAMANWSRYLQGTGGQVQVVSLSKGSDIAKLPSTSFLEAFGRRRAPSAAPPLTNIARIGAAYGKINGQGDFTPFCNWALDVHRVLTMEEDGSTHYEGILVPHGHSVVLPAGALSSKNKIVGWATEHGVAWFGPGDSHQSLAALLQSQEMGLPRGRATEIAGLHDGTFVWPGGSVGPGDWTYVTPMSDAGLAHTLTIPEIEVDRTHALDTLLGLYPHEVITPLLAWVVAALHRSKFSAFPYLMIHGIKGSGKTDTVKFVLDSFFGGTLEGSLKGTEHADMAMACSTNAFPVWFDEIRAGGDRRGRDKREQFENTLRLAYNGKGSSKGGQYGNVSKLKTFYYTAPIIISGEDLMTDPAVVERSVLLRFRKDLLQQVVADGLPEALDILGFDLMKHFASDAVGGDLRGGLIKVVPTGPESLPERQRLSLGALRLGWQWLQDYLGNDYDLPPLDLSAVGEHTVAQSGTSDLDEAILACLEDDTKSGVFMTVKNQIAVRPTLFLEDVAKMHSIDLTTSKATAVIHLLEETYAATRQRPKCPSEGNKQVTAYVFDSEGVVN
tara:strand:- start:5241 stop:7709 length:2469 start_codon:yes stop_codon:yes gene_type:complete